MCVVKVVGRTHCDIIYCLSPTLQKTVVTVKKLLLCEKRRFGKIAVYNAYTVIFIIGRQQTVARLLDGFQMSRGYISTHSYDSEITHHLSIQLQVWFVFLLAIFFSYSVSADYRLAYIDS